MKQRWYDQYPQLSMAISLMQNASMAHRQRVADYLELQILSLNPRFADKLHQTRSPWPFLQRRKTLDMHCWHLIECLHTVPESTCERMAMAVIHYLYCLENDEDWEDLLTPSWHQFEAALSI